MLKTLGGKFIIVGLLALLMVIPLFLAGSVVGQRESINRDVVRELGEEWGGPQTFSGPVLVIPVEGTVLRQVQTEPEDGSEAGEETPQIIREVGARDPIYVLPETLEINATSQSELRSRGIFEVPVYTAALDAAFTFDLSDVPQALREGDQVQWDRAYIRMTVGAAKALRGEAVLTRNGETLRIEPSGSNVRTAGSSDPGGRYGGGGYTPGAAGGQFLARLGDPRQGGEFTLSLGLNGAERLFVTPAGRTTRVTMAGDWPDPSFTGEFLPDDYEVSDDGFTATWTIPHLARNLAQVSRSDQDIAARGATAFGVEYLQINDFYRKAYRATTYSVLFIALTFLTILLLERGAPKQVHPVQYILVGLAQAVFVLLMVAYAEQIGFRSAYLLASIATIGLLTAYGAIGMKMGTSAMVLGAALTTLYAVLYLILVSTDYALLAGASLAFLALAATMWFTRDEEWYTPHVPMGEGKSDRD
ncbi:cell envelope integrity protein CreD [Paracoccaceae bacterium GXU_MW_L88]